MSFREGLTFNDVLIVPKYSDIDTRADIDVTSEYLGSRRLPILSAPMDYVTGMDMAVEMDNLNAYGIVSRFGERPTFYASSKFGLAVGTNWNKAFEWIKDSNPDSICIDVAHGDHNNVQKAIETWILYTEGKAKIIAGNVATREGFIRLAEEGADAIRVGIGPGSVCSTRENTGVGIPQLTAIMDCYEAKKEWGYQTKIIADGGIQTPGDIAKALAAGADAVMLGKMLAGHDESPGEIIDLGPSGKFKKYRGQSLFSSNATRNAPEGVEGLVEYKGPVAKTIESLTNYLRSSMSYVGARNLEEFRQYSEFIRVSPATLQENKTRI